MDMLSPNKASQPTLGEQKKWPDAPAVRGQIYGVNDPVFKKDTLVVMTAETWVDHGTNYERLRRDLSASLDAAQKLKLAYDTAVRELANLQEKHQNLRAAEKSRRMKAVGFKRN